MLYYQLGTLVHPIDLGGPLQYLKFCCLLRVEFGEIGGVGSGDGNRPRIGIHGSKNGFIDLICSSKEMMSVIV